MSFFIVCVSNLILICCWYYSYRKWRYYFNKYIDLLNDNKIEDKLNSDVGKSLHNYFNNLN